MAHRDTTFTDFNEQKDLQHEVNPEELLTISEVAQRLRVDDTTIRRWIKMGILEAVVLPHVGKRRGYRIKKQTVDTLIQPTSEK